MYPISLGFEEARHRIDALLKNGHHAEALLTSVFTFEKTVRRMLRYFAVRRGFTSKHAELLFHRMGFQELREVWPCFEERHRSLPDFLGNALWQDIPRAVTMRNKLVHGEQVYKLKDCQQKTLGVVCALEALRTHLQQDFGFDGWSRLPTRLKPAVSWHVLRAQSIRDIGKQRSTAKLNDKR